MPDFDYDATRARGFAALVSRDLMLVAEPASADRREQARAALAQIARDRRAAEAYPLPPVLLELAEDRTVEGIAAAEGDPEGGADEES